ncbi:sensor histidine kinase [Nocardioides humi]|uniref:Sensor-like histidine kinase SenX3 n=1 Tax=Nocardioides humi TaxID=449461 RepID=A0ABN2AXK4_9ACTN|nr:ATP-binding protein [Nocardioides humi]
MDPTTQAFVAALLGALVAGGAMLAWHLSDRQQRVYQMPEEPLVPDGVAAVLSVLRSSAVVVDESDAVVKASAPAYAMGFVRGTTLLSDELGVLIRQVRRDGQIRETELIVPRAAGAPRHVTARVAPLGSRLVLALVEDRTRERQVDAVRRDFVANVSHELKTPIGAIRLLAEAVQDAADDPDAVYRFASRMLTESDRLSRLIQQIIELSRLQGDEPLDSPVPVSIDDVVASAVDFVDMNAGAKDIQVIAEGEEGLKVLGSEKQVGAAVSNLVANAVAYSEPNSRVVVTRKRVGHNVEISVIDQGIGIPEREVERIFERFYRVDPARHRSTGGTGLGLSIVKHVAATHGGEVRVWSVEGQGSTFTLVLPQHPHHEADGPYLRLAPLAPTPEAPGGRTKDQEDA